MSQTSLHVLHIPPTPVLGLTYNYGPINRGLTRVNEVVRAAEEAGAKVYIHNLPECENNHIVCRGINKRKSTFVRRKSFMEFKKRLEESFSEESQAIITGYNRVCCPKMLAEKALEKSIRVITSDELFFGRSRSDTPFLIHEAIEFYRKNTDFRSSYKDIIELIKRSKMK